MRYSPYILLAVLVTAFGQGESRAQTSVEESVVTFDTLVRDYNVITSGNLTLNNTHTDGGIAVGGNLNLSGNNVLVMHSDTVTGNSPSVYLNGQLNVSSNTYLSSGYVYAPNLSNSTTYVNNGGQRSLQNGGSLSYNTSHPDSYVDPRLAPGPTGVWDPVSTVSTLASVSGYLAAATPTGTINFTSNSIQLSTGLTTGVAVFNLDASTITGLSNIALQINVPADMVFVINVFNADGTTLFGGGGMNFNAGQNNDQLLWNIVADSNPATSSTVNLGTNFYGSILAPMIDLTNGSGGEQNYVNGQVVAASYTHNGAEIHHVDFSAPVTFSAVPEPSTWGLFGLAGCVTMMACRRPRRTA
jgi:choice-of-anchor A domain-containing protein